jgi:glycosyltransferase involved in cell wall biosynthesis
MKISVIIPAYNAARFLPRCLASVFAQTLSPHEVIVVDDGSTDDTAAVAERLGATVLRRPNGGISTARNTGIRHASGDWIALLDADDMWAPEKLVTQAAAIREDTVLAYTGVTHFDDTGIRASSQATNPISARAMIRYRSPFAPSSVLVRRDAMLQSGGFREDVRTCEDWDMWFRLMPYGQFVAVPAALTLYYLYPGSASAQPDAMLRGLDQIIDTTLLGDLHGPTRWLWRRRIRATQLCSAGLIARDNNVKGELKYMLRSLCAWPSPFWEPRRFLMSAVSLKNSLKRSEIGER